MFGKISKYFEEVGQELSKVSWPGREELYGSVAVVLVICSILSVFMFGVDYLLGRIIGLIF